MVGLLTALFLIVGPPSVLATSGYMVAVPFYYAVLNIWFGYCFWRRREASFAVVTSYLVTGMFMFKFLIDPLAVSALPPLPATPAMHLAGSPHEQSKVHEEEGSRWTDWMRADAARLKAPVEPPPVPTPERGPNKLR